MSSQRDLTAEAVQRGAPPGRGYAVGQWLSRVLHPVPLSLLSILIIGLFAVPDRLAGLGWALAGAAIQVVPPTLFFRMRLRQGAYSDEDISVRQQRNELYLFGLLTVLLGTVLLLLLGAPLPIVALFCSAIVLNISSWIINLFWKISIHSAAIGSCATVATLFVWPLGVLLWLGAGALGWARVRTRNHTPMQVVAGLALAAAGVVGTFRAFGLV
ncbi:MAG: PAP2 family protein [Chloroflexaceae bacterium]|jgi:membrane-associated phospholipid phosphatase|nr:PAP2 family protein [Chloroflexaceae bacterium]